jgi:hypothetical protein
VREGFLLFVSFREILLQHIHLQKNTQTYLRLFLQQRLLLNSPEDAPRFLSQKSVQLYGCPSNKCCTACLEICAKISVMTVWNTQQNGTSKLVPTSSKKHAQKSGLYGPRNLCKSIRTVWIFFSKKLCPAGPSISVPINAMWLPWNAVPTFSEMFVAVLLDFCAH